MNKKYGLALFLLASLGTASTRAIDTNLIIGSALVTTSLLSGLLAGFEFKEVRQPAYLPPSHPNDVGKDIFQIPENGFTDYHTAKQRMRKKGLNQVYNRFCKKIGYISGGIALLSGLVGGYMLKNSLLK